MNSIASLLTDIPELLLRLIIVLISLTVHEVAHGYAAYKLGDPTARNFGRLTLNPFKHLDPLGFICMVLFRFGWAKPVPVNTRYFKKPRRDMAITALAGPASNLVLGLIGLLLYSIIAKYFNAMVMGSEYSMALFTLVLSFFLSFATLNVYLAIFNFIPVPPLDGSRILYVFLPDKLYFGVMKYERYIQIAILLLFYMNILDRPMMYICDRILYGMQWIVDLILFI